MRPPATAVALLLLALAFPAAAAQDGCRDYVLSPTRLEVEADPGNGVFHLSGTNGCAYRMSSSGGWLTLGQDAATIRERTVTVNLYWEANPEAMVREAFITVVSEDPEPRHAFVGVHQAPPRDACVRSVAPTTLAFRAEGGSAAVAVDASDTCRWSIFSDVAWIHIPYGTHDGSTQVPLTVDANEGPPRSAGVHVAGTVVTVDQESAIGERPDRGAGTGAGNPVEDAAADWLVNEEPGPEAALVVGAVGLAAALGLRRR